MRLSACFCIALHYSARMCTALTLASQVPDLFPISLILTTLEIITYNCPCFKDFSHSQNSPGAVNFPHGRAVAQPIEESGLWVSGETVSCRASESTSCAKNSEIIPWNQSCVSVSCLVSSPMLRERVRLSLIWKFQNCPQITFKPLWLSEFENITCSAELVHMELLIVNRAIKCFFFPRRCGAWSVRDASKQVWFILSTTSRFSLDNKCRQDQGDSNNSCIDLEGKSSTVLFYSPIMLTW